MAFKQPSQSIHIDNLAGTVCKVNAVVVSKPNIAICSLSWWCGVVRCRSVLRAYSLVTKYPSRPIYDPFLTEDRISGTMIESLSDERGVCGREMRGGIRCIAMLSRGASPKILGVENRTLERDQKMADAQVNQSWLRMRRAERTRFGW
jgi:hypothetical protein